MRDYQQELIDRVAFIRRVLEETGASGIVYGNSGGKDSALVGILCKKACDNVLGVIMPCSSSRNFGEDMRDAKAIAEQYGIDTVTVDLTAAQKALVEAIAPIEVIGDMCRANIAPRLRMTTLYAIAHARGALVAGTGNRSEAYMGYFTKWGDGAYDLNPISDLTVREIYEFLEFLDAPQNVRKKAPSAGLFEGQTDEGEMGVRYADIDAYLLGGEVGEDALAKMRAAHARSAHKRRGPIVFKGMNDEDK